ncbi:MAG: folate family ECF transporter S component [Clostridia bacterium]|nr:folate family ECF transporter S component [Clostridia bacterium]
MKNKRLAALIITAIFASLSIVLGKFAAISIGDTIRISFENLPIMLASFMFGPIYGAVCGLVADLLGCLLRGYAIIPFITVASVVMGVIPGLMTRFVFKNRKTLSVMISGMTSHAVASMVIKTVALHIAYLTPYSYLIPTRVPVYIAVGLAESYICAVLLKRKFVAREIL